MRKMLIAAAICAALTVQASGQKTINQQVVGNWSVFTFEDALSNVRYQMAYVNDASVVANGNKAKLRTRCLGPVLTFGGKQPEPMYFLELEFLRHLTYRSLIGIRYRFDDGPVHRMNVENLVPADAGRVFTMFDWQRMNHPSNYEVIRQLRVSSRLRVSLDQLEGAPMLDFNTTGAEQAVAAIPCKM
jgi:hypothetical protein